MSSASSSSEPEPAPRHRAADAQRRARLDELAEARRQLDEEPTLLHQELGMDVELRDNDLHRTSPCRRSPMTGMATGVSGAQLPSSRTAVHQRHRHAGRHAGRHATTIDAPTRAQTSVPTLTLTLRRSSGGHRRTLPLCPCCCVVARRQRPPRSDEYASN
jgi:hypothetical protein